jgi:hypothetical protein
MGGVRSVGKIGIYREGEWNMRSNGEVKIDGMARAGLAAMRSKGVVRGSRMDVNCP